VRRFTTVDHVDRVALVATVGESIVGIGRYDVVAPGRAELAFTVRDDHQGRGLGSVLLEHLAAVARAAGIETFVAEVLADNRRMLRTFVEAGYRPTQHISDGVVTLTFDVEPTPQSVAVRVAREHRAESRSIAGLLAPGSVAVVGAGRRPGGMGHELVRHLVDGQFTGTVAAVNARAGEAETICGVRTYRTLADVPHPVELVVVAVPAPEVLAVVGDAAAIGAVGLVVVTAGFAESDEAGRTRQADLVSLARGQGMRVIGPNALGLLNTAPDVRLNASLALSLPPSGRTGFFCQSGALGGSILDLAARRGVGTSTFVSAGNRSDVSGNDLMQYWEDDPATDVVLLYLESIGNPRKFTRIARRLSRRKPVVAVRSGRSTQAYPLGHRVRRSALPREALDALFSQSGVIQTGTLPQMLDIAVLLEHQPLPKGAQVAVVGNSDALAVLATDAIEAEGLTLAGSPVALRGDGSPAAFAAALAAVADDPTPDSLLVLHVPPFDVEREAFLGQILAVADRSSRPVVAVLGGGGTQRGLLRGERVVVPTFDTVEDAVKAMAAVHWYARWLASPEGVVPELDDVHRADAHVVVDRLIVRLPPEPAAELNVSALDGGDLVELLAAFGISVRPAMSVTTASEAVAAARRLGYPVALTARDPKDRHRADGVGVRLDLGNDRAVRTAWQALRGELGTASGVEHSVQSMAPRGVEARIGSAEDALFGPVVSLAVGGDVVQLLGDRAYRIPPLTDADAHALVTSPRAAPLLSRVAPEGILALEELLIRVGQLAEACPELASLVLDPVLVTPEGPVVLAARAVVRRPRSRTDGDARRLR
jgi:acyl-CoA synthetase (NDP forming)/GNAT superfamily N-acetyltransferase